MRLTDSLVVRAPVERVFDFYADPMGAAIVDPKATVQVLTDGPVGVGTRSTIARPGRVKLGVEIVEYRRPERIVFRMVAGRRPGSILVTQRFAEVAGGTRCETTADYLDFKGLAALFLAIGRPLYARQASRASQRVAAIAEAHIAAQPAP